MVSLLVLSRLQRGASCTSKKIREITDVAVDLILHVSVATVSADYVKYFKTDGGLILTVIFCCETSWYLLFVFCKIWFVVLTGAKVC